MWLQCALGRALLPVLAADSLAGASAAFVLPADTAAAHSQGRAQHRSSGWTAKDWLAKRGAVAAVQQQQEEKRSCFEFETKELGPAQG